MKQLLGTIFHRNAHSLPRRAYFWCLQRFVGVFGKTQRVYFVTINGRRYKRVVFSDSLQALQVEQALSAFSDTSYFPALIERHENELLLSFVEGQPFDPGQSTHAEFLADLFCELYRHKVNEVALESSRLPQRLATDLQFLQQSGVIDHGTLDRLSALADALQPETLLMGWDYVDPVAKNFLVKAQSIVAIDVESLVDNMPLGTGLAKAQLHWMDDAATQAIIEQILSNGGPDIGPQFDYVGLCFRVAWAKRKFLQGKRNFIARAELSNWQPRQDVLSNK